ncbi:hypothetical protein IWQ60_005930 [Tieghemiomyces parasiticus]|uniref:RRM domain-containing protein n=1 Tax=Tieghemiomyces parasiticus TaxID=78921 RepID=A0A9W8DU67_9FUNG|nr:hypothetical protein IWQ60_005930 [Tieghemiomyces parasiticus]
MPNFPKADDFESDPRVDLLPETDKWVFTDEQDGLEYEYDPDRAAWFPMVSIIESQQSAYGTAIPSHEITESASDKRKRLLETQSTKTAKRKINSPDETQKPPVKSVYIQGLPTDVTVDELKATFSRFGLIMEDFETKRPKIKLYTNEDGTPKGDALITYFKPESVPLAINLMDDAPLRPGGGDILRVSEAEFKAKESASADGGNSEARAKVDARKKKMRLQQMEKKLTWFESEEPTVSEKHRKTVILKHMFDPAEFDEDPTLLLDLKEDIRHECEKLGEVTVVKLFDKSSDGVVSVKYIDKASAAACVELMNGRWFGGRQVEATIFDGKGKYEQSNVKESDEQTAERLEKFAAWLEEDADA